MFFDLSDQLKLFLACFICGVVLSLFYDLIRMSRMTLGVRYGFDLVSREDLDLPLLKPKNKKKKMFAKHILNIIVFIGDVCFFVLAAFSLLCVFFNYGGGKMRLIATAFATFGFFACHYTVSAVFVRVFAILRLFVCIVLEYLVFFLMLPIRKIVIPICRVAVRLALLIGNGFLYLYLIHYTARYKRRCVAALLAKNKSG